ncbi:MAG: preprotein translocase subunit SecA [Mariniblastus sp.]|jgi:preprotein translocase subunit SecA
MNRWRGVVSRIEGRAATLEKLDSSELRKRSLALKYDALAGKPLDDLIVPAFALVREAGRRTIGLRHYPVQLLGGVSMHYGSIAVMQTGEGKTLAATLPMYLAALTGKGAHLATANDYLACRDAELMQPVYESLGLSVGVVQSDTSRADRQKSYACDVTYSTAKEIGFDFLRDRLFRRRMELGHAGFVASMVGQPGNSESSHAVQRDLNYMLVDEADSILIDEARTPLIVSSMPDEVAQAKVALYQWSFGVNEQFQTESHYTVDPKSRKVSLNADGRRLARKLPQPELLLETPLMDIYEQLEQAIFVEQNYVRDRQYVIRDGEIVIVDEFTGRLAEGRKWRAGLHQAIEAREGLEVSVETGEAARITIQDLFLRYDRLSGMTGTAANSASELRKIYSVRVVDVPTNKPPKRIQWPDLVFGSESQKWNAIADEIESIYRTGRPVLVGTRSIDKSEMLAQILAKRNVPHDVLNARNLAREAQIVAGAGQVSRVTVATNMAGRGTDIKVSGPSLDLGGLHVICTEVHESARIDRQLIGRCGRQGDPGTFRQFMSLEDEILKLGLGPEKAERLLGHQAQPAKLLARFANLFRTAQSNIEQRHFKGRKMLLHQEKIRQEMQREMGQDPYLDTAGA